MCALYAPTIDGTPSWRVTPDMLNTPAGEVIHDALGRPVRSTGPDGSIRLVSHGTWQTRLSDENDNANLSLDPANPAHATLLARLSSQIDTPQVQTFDAYDRITEILEDLGGGRHQRTRYRYDALGRPIEVIDAFGRSAIRVIYDFTGQVIAFTQIDAGTHRFVFNAAQRLILRIDANGRRLRTTYDTAGRPFELYELPGTLPIASAWDSPTRRLITRTTYGDSGDPVALTANACGKVMQVLDPVGLLKKTYDRQGNKASTSRRFFLSDPNIELDHGWIPPSVDVRPLEDEQYRIDYAYDATGRLQEITYPSVNGGSRPIVSMQRTLLGLLKQVDYQPSAGQSTAPIITDTLYNTRNARVAAWLGNGQATTYGYKADNPRLSSLAVGPAATGTMPSTNLLFSTNYDYDLVGNPIEVTRLNGTALIDLANDGRTPTEVSSYSYDALHRLTGSSVFDSLSGSRRQSQRNYQYDLAENLIAYEDRPGPEPQIHPGTNRLTGFALPGQPVASSLTYDTCGSVTSSPHLTNIVWDERGHLSHLTHTSRRQARYSYDLYGERRRRLVRDGNRILEVRSIDGIFEFEKEVENTATTKNQTRIHIMGLLERQAIVVNDLLLDTERIFYLHGDHLTSVLCVTDDTGVPVSQKDYLPYGLIAGNSGLDFERGFAGLGIDTESGLIYMSLRYYDPSIGRFLSPDPYMVKYLDGRNAQGIYRPGNLNPYIYAAGNPLVYYDPTGGFIITAILIGAGIVAGGLALAGIGQAMQGSGNAVVRGFGKAFEVIGLIAAGAVLATVGAFLVPIGLLFASPLLLIPVVGPLAFGALAVVAGLVMIAAPITGIAHGAITGAFGVYDFSNPSGYLAFIADTTWGLSQTTLGVIGITVAAIGGGSVNTGLSSRTNVLAMEAGFAGGGLSLGPYIFAGSTFASDPELADHESFHTMQNRIFGPIFTFTVIPLTAISNIMTAIAPPANNPGFVNAGEPPNWDNWINWWEAWAEAAV
jgi:RHS repeat-associated protein